MDKSILEQVTEAKKLIENLSAQLITLKSKAEDASQVMDDCLEALKKLEWHVDYDNIEDLPEIISVEISEMLDDGNEIKSRIENIKTKFS